MSKRSSRLPTPSRAVAAHQSTPARGRASPATRELAGGDDGTTVNEDWAYLIVLIGVLFNAWALRSELTAITSRNDGVFHLLMVQEASAAMLRGDNPLDFWIPQLELGFPQFLYYQHLPHLLLAGIHRAMGGAVAAETLLNVVRYLLLVLMPITVAWSMSRMGFSRTASCVGGIASTLFSANQRYGLEYESYVWNGFGMLAQLAGVHLFFVSLATLSKTLRTGKGAALAAATIAALVLSHLVLATMFVVSATVMTVVGGERSTMGMRALRLVLVGMIAGCLTAYMLLPFLQSSKAFLSSQPWLDGMWSTPQLGRNAARLLTGDLFDRERLPILTLATLAGVGICAWRADSTHRIAAVALLAMAGVYLLRPGSGGLGDLLPAKSGYVTSRFLSGVGIFAVLCIGVAADALVGFVRTRILARSKPIPGVVAQGAMLALIIVLLAPALAERWNFHAKGHRLIEGTAAAASDANVAAAVAYAASRPGRVYAGTRLGWGCEMAVGEDLCVTDRLQARQLRLIGNPMQSLALSSGLVLNIPEDSAFVYDLYDIRTVLRPIGTVAPPFYTPLVRFGAIGVYAAPSSGIAQFAAVTERRRTDSQRELFNGHLEWIRRGSPQRHEVIRWDYHRPAGVLGPRASCPNGGTFANESFESQQMAVRATCTTTAGPLALVFKSMYHPQWRVWVDGTRAEPYMVSPGYLALDVPAGTHDVVARYVPDRRKLPLLLIGLTVLAASVVFRRRLERFTGAL